LLGLLIFEKQELFLFFSREKQVDNDHISSKAPEISTLEVFDTRVSQGEQNEEYEPDQECGTEVSEVRISLQDDYYHLYKGEMQDGQMLSAHFKKLGLDIKKEIFFMNSAFEHLIDLGIFIDLRGIQRMLISLRERAKNFKEKFSDYEQIWNWVEFVEAIDLYDRFVDQLRVFFGTLSAQAKLKKISFFPQH
jgi:hypothetical protein